MIGLIPLMDEEKESYWMLPGYMKALEQAGAIPVMLPLCTDKNDLGQLMEHIDGILFTGGHDVNPALYGEERISECGIVCGERDKMESILFQMGLEKDIPMFGICRGIQFINAMCGGSLYQDLPLQRPTATEHHQTPPYDIPVHRVDISQGTPLYKLLKVKELQVNSYHHQAIRVLGDGLEVMAVSEDGLVEAVYMPAKKFVWAVQWHPEFNFMVDENSRAIMKLFVEQCRN